MDNTTKGHKMVTMLGKRKRETVRVSKRKLQVEENTVSESAPELETDAQEVFRRHFEAQYAPLPIVAKQTKTIQPDLEVQSGEETDWDGISDEEEDGIQVIEHTDVQSRMAAMSKEEFKAFMSSKVPKSSPLIPSIRDKAGAMIADDDPSEAANLKKDLALQRLLSESHLLESSSNPTLSGNNRHKATDLRIQALGAKKSALTQEKMPMSHRKGMIAKRTEKEEKRRREARENGIILEKAKMAIKKGGDAKRERGVGAPGVGKFSGGTLKLSKKDIFDIEGPKRGSSSRGGRGSGRGRGKRGR